jgi:hypothetical protein
MKEGTTYDGPFSQYCAYTAPIWKLYMDQAKIFDDNLGNLFNSDLDPLLIFVNPSLFETMTLC